MKQYFKILGSKYTYQQYYDSIIALFLNNYSSHWELNVKLLAPLTLN